MHTKTGYQEAEANYAESNWFVQKVFHFSSNYATEGCFPVSGTPRDYDDKNEVSVLLCTCEEEKLDMFQNYKIPKRDFHNLSPS